MPLQQWTQRSRLSYEQLEYWNPPSFVVNCQPEVIRKQGLHHESHLVLGGISLCRPLNIETSGGHPIGQLREQELLLIVRDFVCELDVHNQRQIRRSEVPSIGDINIARPQREIGTKFMRSLRGRALVNGSSIEHHLASGCC